MAESITLARPYAKAAFESALEANKLADWSEQLMLASALVSDKDMLAILKHPGLASEEKAGILVDIGEGKLASGIDNFIRVLAENQRLLLLPYISVLFELLKSQQEATIDVMVETAFKLNASQRTKLIESLKRKLEREVNVRTTVNKKLIGGALIRAGDLVIDASVRGKLVKMADAIGS